MDKEFNGVIVAVDSEGYLTDVSQWNRDVAQAIATEEDIDLNEDHWKVIDYIQNQFNAGTALSIRRIGKSGVVSIKEFYTLFPEGPLKKASRIAGIPKPKSCI